jgi:hypothetical protein
MVIAILLLLVTGLGRWVVLRGRGGSGTWLAPKRTPIPFPVGGALGRLRILGFGLARNATIFVFVPIVGVLGTLGTGRGRRRIRGASFRQATAFVTPPE